MRSINQAFETSKSRSARIYRWVTAWLITGAVIALLLLANSIRDYLFVSRWIATEEVRHQMSQHVAAVEQQLRRNALATGTSLSALMEDADRPAWVELRDPAGKVLEHKGAAAGRLFSKDEERSHFLNREPLFEVVTTTAGDVVVEVFPIHLGGTLGPTSPLGSPALAQPGPRALLLLEVGIPLSSVDRSAPWTIRRNLIINCTGALALLATVVLAGLGFRSYARGKRLEEQLEIARQVQSELLPSLADAYVGVQLATEYTPAEQVGGDFYDVFQIKDDGVALVMGDVSGKGVPAALLMGVIHGAVRSSLWSESASRHEWESEQLNRLLCEHASGERYASMFWCYHDPLTQSLRYVNAGHCPPLLTRKSGSKVEISRLDAGGPVLGILPNAQYEQTRLNVCPGDILVMYSDGLVETSNSLGEEYGESRLRELLSTEIEKGPDEIRQAILTSLAAFSGATALQDDLTFVVAQFRSPSNGNSR